MSWSVTLLHGSLGPWSKRFWIADFLFWISDCFAAGVEGTLFFCRPPTTRCRTPSLSSHFTANRPKTLINAALLRHENTESLSPLLPSHSWPKFKHGRIQNPKGSKGESVAGSDSGLRHARQKHRTLRQTRKLKYWSSLIAFSHFFPFKASTLKTDWWQNMLDSNPTSSWPSARTEAHYHHDNF